MKHISKIISLNDAKTLFPLTYPCVINGEVSYVTKENILKNTNANYGGIPLGVNENVCGDYNQFSDYMKREFAGKTLYYDTIHEWYKFFLDYKSRLQEGCQKPFASMKDYATTTLGITDNRDLKSYLDMDTLFFQRGGDAFFDWLNKHYFVSLNLIQEYIDTQTEENYEHTYPEWLDMVNNYYTDILYYPDVNKLYAKFMKLDKLYRGYTNPRDSEDCCECSYYIERGGHDMFVILGNWLEKTDKYIDKINNIVLTYQNELLPSFSLSVPLSTEIKDMGEYTNLCKEFVAGATYNVGNVVVFNEKCYILIKGTGCFIDPTTKEVKFNENDWLEYDKYLESNNPTMVNTWSSTDVISGRMHSSLDLFLRDDMLVDLQGNVLPGSYESDTSSLYPHPAEGTVLGLMYQLGKTANERVVKDGYYFGDVLYEIELYAKSADTGEIINESRYLCTQSMDPVEAISMFISSASNFDTDGLIYADFKYYKNTFYSYEENGIVAIKLYTKHIDTELNSDPTPIRYGIECVDHCILELNTFFYHLSMLESYPIKAYIVKKEKDLLDTNNDILTEVTNFKFYPIIVDNPPFITTPAFRNGQALGYSLTEKPTSDIYIDRGYATVLDKHLQLGEITSIEGLINYTNGAFSFIDPYQEITT